MAISAIWPVMGARRKISSRMGSPRQNDFPRSPRRTSRIQSRYWTDVRPIQAQARPRRLRAAPC